MRTLPDKIVDDIIEEFADRVGCDEFWSGIPSDLQKEIREAWKQLVIDRLIS
jgi:hypothetical protein